MPTASLDSASLVLAAASDLAPQIRSSADASERSGRIDPEILTALKRIGVFRMAMPRSMGGLELDPVTQIELVEELARADGSVGWVAMIGSDGGFYSSLLSEQAAKELYGPDPDVVTAGFTEPLGTAEPVADGYVVSGRWPFGSASSHASWLASGCRVSAAASGDGQPTGKGQWRIAMLPADACVLEDTWHTTGLRATGSHHYRADGVFVPRSHTFCFDRAPRDLPPLYTLPTMYRANMAGVPLGIARAARDTVAELAGSHSSAANSAVLHSALAHAEALVGSARAFVMTTVSDLWDTVNSGEVPSIRQRAQFRLSIATAFDSCRQAVDILYRSAGGASVYAKNLVDRQFRDMLTVCQHAIAQPRSYAAVGRVLLGLEPEELLF